MSIAMLSADLIIAVEILILLNLQLLRRSLRIAWHQDCTRLIMNRHRQAWQCKKLLLYNRGSVSLTGSTRLSHLCSRSVCIREHFPKLFQTYISNKTLATGALMVCITIPYIICCLKALMFTGWSTAYSKEKSLSFIDKVFSTTIRCAYTTPPYSFDSDDFLELQEGVKRYPWKELEYSQSPCRLHYPAMLTERVAAYVHWRGGILWTRFFQGGFQISICRS